MALAYSWYYIQRLSDGKILGGYGPQSGNYALNPNDWRTLTGSQLQTQAYWVFSGTGGWNWNQQKSQLTNVIDSLPLINGSWQQDLYRILPIQWKGNI